MNRDRVRLLAALVPMVVLLSIALGTSCGEEQSLPASSAQVGGQGDMDGGADAAPSDGGEADAPDAGAYDPDASRWAPVTWPNPCEVELALQPELGAPPLTWSACGEDTMGCDQQLEQPILDTNSHGSKASVVPWSGGYRIAIRESFKTVDAKIAAIYETDGTPMLAWRTRKAHCQMVRPILTVERVWFGVTLVESETSDTSAFIAPKWDELTSIRTTIQQPFYLTSWSASSDIAVGWVVDAATLFVEDLPMQQTAIWGGGVQGHPDYAFPNAVGTSIVALTAPDGYPDVTVWDRSTGAFIDLVDPSPARVASANSDGQTLVWVVKPDADAPGELWTSPMTATPQGLQPVMRRPTPVIKTHGTAAYGGFYAVYSYSEPLVGGGPGDGLVHVYRLSDAQHWAFAVPKSSIHAMWIYHVDEDYVFYSGYGPIVRQRMDVLGRGDPPP